MRPHAAAGASDGPRGRRGGGSARHIALAILVVVAASAGLILALQVDPLLAGGVLLAGTVLALVLGAIRTARRTRA